MKVNGELKNAQLEACKTANRPSASGVEGRVLYDVDTNKIIVSNGTTWVDQPNSATTRMYWKEVALTSDSDVVMGSDTNLVTFSGLTAGTYRFSSQLRVKIDHGGDQQGLPYRLIVNVRFKQGSTYADMDEFNYSVGSEFNDNDGEILFQYVPMAIYHIFTVTGSGDTSLTLSHKGYIGYYTGSAWSTSGSSGANGTAKIWAAGTTFRLEQLPSSVIAGTWG